MKHWGVLLVLFFSVLTIIPFFAQGFFPMHDDTQVQRVYEMAKALSDGHFPVRWSTDLGYGYGYPLFNFYAPLPYYFGAIVHILGVNILDSTKIMMVFGILLSSISMYFLAKEFWGKIGGVVAGLFYVYAPYHAVNIYVRGDVGEIWAYAFIPFIFYSLWTIYKDPKLRYVVIGAGNFAALILSHNLTAMIVTPFILLAILILSFPVLQKKKAKLSIIFLAILFIEGILLSSFYALPALLEMKYTNVSSQVGGGANFRDHFVCVGQLWESPWGFGGSIPGCVDGLSFSFGKMRIVIVLFSLLFFLRWQHITKGRVKVILFALLVLLISIYMMLPLSQPIWERFSVLAFLQYPWRFLSIASFAMSFLIGGVGWFFSDMIRRMLHFRRLAYTVGIIFVFLPLFFNERLFRPQYVYTKSVNDFVNEKTIKWTTSKISDEFMPPDFMKPKNENDIIHKRVDEGEIVIDKTNKLIFITEFEKEKSVLIKIAPFPAWQVLIDGIKTQSQFISSGIEVNVPPGRHEILVDFVSTPVERFGNSMSIIGIIFIFGAILSRKARFKI